MAQVYIIKEFRLILTKKQKLDPFKPYTGEREPNGYIRCFNANCPQNLHTRYLIPLGIRSVIFIMPV